MKFKHITPTHIEDSLVNLKQLTFEVTDACNLKCKYCGYGEFYEWYDQREAKYLSFDKFKVLIDYLADIWNSKRSASFNPRTFISFYGGEPLLNMRFIKRAVEYMEQLQVDRKFVFTMTTNAVLLDKHMDYLAEKKFSLLISLDADEYGHSYRVDHNGENSFKTVFANVKKLQQTFPDYFSEHVNFNSVLHNRNSVEKIHNFIDGAFGKHPSISELNNSGIKKDKLEEFYKTYRNKSESLGESENYEKLSKALFMSEPNTYDLFLYLYKYSGNVFKNYNDLLIDQDKREIIPTGTCVPFSKKMFVTTNGKILPCERIDHCFSLGTVCDDKVNLDMDAIAHSFNSYLDKMHKQCSVCHRKNCCIQCMYYIPDIGGSKPACNGFMDKSDFSEFSSNCLNHLKKNPELYEELMTKVMLD